MKRAIVAFALFLMLVSSSFGRLDLGLDLDIDATPESSGVGPAAGDGLLLEAADYLLLETGDYLLLE